MVEKKIRLAVPLIVFGACLAIALIGFRRRTNAPGSIRKRAAAATVVPKTTFAEEFPASGSLRPALQLANEASRVPANRSSRTRADPIKSLLGTMLPSLDVFPFDEIHRLQNPRDCSKARFLVARWTAAIEPRRGGGVGMGRMVRDMAGLMAFAHRLERAHHHAHHRACGPCLPQWAVPAVHFAVCMLATNF